MSYNEKPQKQNKKNKATSLKRPMHMGFFCLSNLDTNPGFPFYKDVSLCSGPTALLPLTTEQDKHTLSWGVFR